MTYLPSTLRTLGAPHLSMLMVSSGHFGQVVVRRINPLIPWI